MKLDDIVHKVALGFAVLTSLGFLTVLITAVLISVGIISGE